LPAEAAARLSLDTLGFGEQRVSLNDESMPLALALRKLVRAGEPFFDINTDGATIHLSSLRAHKIQLLTINPEAQSEASWEKIAGAFLSCQGFVQACVLNEEYTFWQNAQDPLQYEAAGRSYAGRRMVSNGLPSPLTRSVIDVSHNPGRWIIKPGYVEMVGREMWLGRPFWSRVGADRWQDLAAASAYRVREIDNSTTSIAVPGKVFIDETTADVQDDLRRLLFPSPA